MKLHEISKKETKVQSAIKAMRKYATILEYAEFYRMVGNSDAPRKAATASGGQYRALNDNYVSNTTAPLYASMNLKIFGDKIELDKAHERRAGDIPSERARQLLSFAKQFGRNFQNEFFNGSTLNNVKAWNGLAKIMPAQQVIIGSEEGLLLQTGNSDTAYKAKQQFIEKLQQLVSMVDGGPDVIYMNESVLARLTSIASDIILWNKNEFGNYIPYFAGVPLRTAGYNSAGTAIIQANELFGEYNTATTIYAMKFGEKEDLTIATNVGLTVDNIGLVNNMYVDVFELDADIGLLNNRAVAALKGIVIE
mgnify:CR=1 FL=1